MVRKYSMALVVLLALVSSNFALAFGLGEIQLKSYLNQPFEAEINLVDIDDLTESEIIPKLASPKDFANVGVQRDFFLTQLDFEVRFEAERKYIRITSRDPVTEPFLDFLVEFLWPEGRLLREYTVLLDPPSYAEAAQSQPQVPVVKQVMQSPTQEVNVQESIAESSKLATPVAEAVTVEDSERKTITTEAKDTLWSIASRERPNESVSVQQTMLAIKKLNPDAFEHNNINYLKKNQVLRIPNEQEIRALATREALGIVADQNREWAGKTLASGGTLPVDTAKLVGSQQVTPMDDDGEVGDQMKLVSDNETASDGSGAGSSDELVRIQRENKQLKNNTKSLQEQVETSERLLSLKDQQIAELQARLAEQGADTTTSIDQEAESLIGESSEAQSEEIPLDSELSPEQEIDITSSEDDEIEAALEAAKSDAEAFEGTTSNESISAESGEEVPTSFEADPNAAPKLDTELVKKPVKSKQQEPGLFDSPLLLVIAALVLVVLLGGGYFLYKRRMSSANSSMESPMELSEAPDDFSDFGGNSQPSDDFDDDFFSTGSDSESETDSSSILTEADQYISYNRHAQAVELLSSEIDQGNEDIAIKLKLLEAYTGTGAKDAFDVLSAEVLEEDVSQQTYISSLAAAFEANVNEDDFDISLDDLANDLDSDFDTGSTDDDNELSLDSLLEEDDSGNSGLDLDLEMDTKQSDEVDAELGLDLNSDSDDESLELDFSLEDSDSEDELSLDDTVILETESADDLVSLDANEEDDGLDLDLDGLSFDDEDEETELDSGKSEASKQDDDDLSLDLDFEEDSLSVDDDLNLDDDLSLDEDLSFDDDSSDMDSSVGMETDDSDDELTLDMSDDDDVNLDFDDAVDSSTGSDSLFSETDNEDFDLPDEGDEAATKLDLARAYIDMGDDDGAKDILEEVLAEGDAKQKAEAQELLSKL